MCTLESFDSKVEDLPGIYVLRNKSNNKCYVGQSVCVKRRLKQHRNASVREDDHLYRAVRKQGLSGFEVEVVYYPEAMLDELEKKLIYILGSLDPEYGYNKREGGKEGATPNDETKEKMSASMENWWKNLSVEEWNVMSTKLSMGQKRYWSDITEEERQKICDLRKMACTPEVRERMSDIKKQAWDAFSLEEQTIRIEEIKKYWSKPEAKLKRAESIKNVFSDPEYRARVSDRAKEWWVNLTPEEKAELQEKHRNIWNSFSEEKKQQNVEKHKRWWQDLPEEERQNIKDKQSKAQSDFWNNLSTEEKKRRGDKMRSYWLSLSEEEMDSKRKMASEKMKSFWKNMTEEQKEDRKRKHKKNE